VLQNKTEEVMQVN